MAQIFKKIFEPLLPPCENCHEQFSHTLFCKDCWQDLQFKEACRFCGIAPLARGLEEVCLPCRQKKQDFRHLQVEFFYRGGFKSWLYDIKESARLERLREISPLALRYRPASDIEVLVPVAADPLQTERRTFDFSLELAHYLARAWGLPVAEGLIRRTPYLSSSKSLHLEERKESLKKTLFANASQDRPSGFKRALLIDDVMTTGASTHLHAQLLKTRLQFEAVDVYCLARVTKDAL